MPCVCVRPVSVMGQAKACRKAEPADEESDWLVTAVPASGSEPRKPSGSGWATCPISPAFVLGLLLSAAVVLAVGGPRGCWQGARAVCSAYRRLQAPPRGRRRQLPPAATTCSPSLPAADACAIHRCAGCQQHGGVPPPLLPSDAWLQAGEQQQQQQPQSPQPRSLPLPPWRAVLSPAQLRRGLPFYGSGARIEAMAAKLLAGQPIKAFTLGGSVTRGAGASSEAATYPARFFQFLNATFPHRYALRLWGHAGLCCVSLNGSRRTAGVLPARSDPAPRRPLRALPPWRCRAHVLQNKGIGATTSGLYSVCAEQMVPADTDLVVRLLGALPPLPCLRMRMHHPTAFPTCTHVPSLESKPACNQPKHSMRRSWSSPSTNPPTCHTPRPSAAALSNCCASWRGCRDGEPGAGAGALLWRAHALRRLRRCILDASATSTVAACSAPAPAQAGRDCAASLCVAHGGGRRACCWPVLPARGAAAGHDRGILRHAHSQPAHGSVA